MSIIDMHMLLALFILALQMHTDMGDERGIRLRCICLGDAALRGSRMSARGPEGGCMALYDVWRVWLYGCMRCMRCIA